jgi:hypothetical protein
MNNIEKLILKETENLPQNVLREILDFILFIKEKRFRNKKYDIEDSLNYDLHLLDNKELLHLEEEFRDYKELYPLE